MPALGDVAHRQPAMSGAWDRPRLLQRMGPFVPGNVTVLSAPAGYGKSVLAEQWIAAQVDVSVIRVAVRADDETRFAPGVLPELAALDQGILLVDGIDSVHDTDQPNHVGPAAMLADLVERAPANVHVVVTCRAPWYDRVARLRARGRDVVRLDGTDLAFTAPEARLLVQQLAGCELSERQVAAVVDRTEGWAVGLQAIALDVRGGLDVDTAITMERGDDPRLVAYFETNVLARQSERVRQFLVRSSVLAELSASACSAVTGDPAARALLQLLEQRGAFVHQGGEAGDGFVVPALFSEVLRHELRVVEPRAVVERLLLRAAAWHAKRGDPSAAASTLVEAEAWDQLLALVDRFGVRIFESEEAERAIRWLDAIPAGWGNDRTGVALRLAVLHTMNGQTRLAEQLVHDLEVAGLAPGEQAVTSALRATWAFFDADGASVLRAADTLSGLLDDVGDGQLPDVLGLTSRDDLTVLAGTGRARALWQEGDVAAARDALLQVVHRPNVYPPWLLHAMGTLALLEAWAGSFRAAQQHARQALRVANRTGLVDHPATLDARLALAHLSRELGSQGGAEAFLDSAAAILVRARRPVAAGILAVERSLWHLAGGRPEQGLDALRDVRAAGEAPPPPIVEAAFRAAEAKLCLAMGDRDRAALVLESSPSSSAALAQRTASSVQLAVSGGDLEQAQGELAAWVVDDAVPRSRLERDLWSAIVELARGSRRQAVQHGLQVLATAETEGHVRLFLDAGRPAERLLNAVVNVDPRPYVRGLVAAAQARSAAGRGATAFGLTARELAVARYLPTPLSSAEIAAQLYISRNTLKTHLQTVYRKLGVSGRQEAIRRAEELGLA